MSVALETSAKTQSRDSISIEHTSMSVLCGTGALGDFYSEAGIWQLMLVVILLRLRVCSKEKALLL